MIEEQGVSPRALARVTGFFYLIIMAAAMFAEAFVRDRLIVAGDAAATAHNILASESLWRWGVAADVTVMVCDVAVAALLFILLRPVSLAGSTIAAAFRLAYAAAIAVGAGFLAAPVGLLKQGGGGEALSLFAVRMHGAIFDVGLVLFGIHLILAGLLIARSGFLPRWLGAGLVLAGVCYAANSYLGLVSPLLAKGLFPWILLPGLVFEGALTLWLLIVGLNPQRWAARAGALA